jgi:hypothetical protein
MEKIMRKWLLLIASAAAMTALSPVTSSAQVGVDTPLGGFSVGEPGYRYDRDWNGPRGYQGRRFHDRNVYLRGEGDCRTVTIQRDDGSGRRVRRCD